jgi:hypothetical protein
VAVAKQIIERGVPHLRPYIIVVANSQQAARKASKKFGPTAQ